MNHFLFFAALLIANAIGAKVTLPHIMGNDMVLQQQSLCRLWGKATPGKSLTVTTSWNNRKYKTIASENGEWLVEVNTPKAGGPYKITFDDGEKTILDNILIGEVWICSGQSNMEMPVQGFLGQPTNNSLETIAKAGNYPNIRFISLPQTDSTQPLSDCDATWKVSNSENIPTLSANAYFFAKMLNETLHVPVGIIAVSYTHLGLCPTSYNITGFEMAGADRKFHPAKARIVDKEAKLVVECEEVPEPIAVRYAFHSWYETNLTNTFGLPAQPFRTDNWDNVE